MPPTDNKRIIEGFKKGRTLGRKALSPYLRWGFSDQPFQKDLIYTIDNFFIDSQSHDFSIWLGAINQLSADANKKVAFMIGPEYIGKTTLVRKVASVLNEELVPTTYLSVPETVNGFILQLRREDLMDTQLLFLDDADSLCNDISMILEEISQNIDADYTTILIISPSTYLWLWKNAPAVLDQHILDSYKMRVLGNDAVIDLLQRRIDHFKEGITPQPFTNESFEKIADYSMGLPGLALELAEGCLDFEIETITADYVDGKAKELNYEIAKRIAEGDHKYWEGSRGEILRELAISLSPVEQQQLKELRGARKKENLIELEGTSSAELVERISLSSQGTTSYHLKKLIEGGIVKQTKLGRNQIYTIHPTISNAVELALMSSTMIHPS
jgi:DNA-binding transcriptional ArsR family regulator